MSSGDEGVVIPSRAADRSPPVENPDESSNRRKRHSHHHRHGHRHRSKHDREKRARVDGLKVDASFSRWNDDREEGEILEEVAVVRADGGGDATGERLDSEFESGEIKGDDGADVSTVRGYEGKVCGNNVATSLDFPNHDSSKLGAVEKAVAFTSNFVSSDSEHAAEISNNSIFEDQLLKSKAKKYGNERMKMEDERTSRMRRGREPSKEDDSGDSRRMRSKSPASKESSELSKRPGNALVSRSPNRSKRERERSSSPRESKSKSLNVRRSPSNNVRYCEELRGRSRSKSPSCIRSPKRSSRERYDDSRYYSRTDDALKRSGRHVDDGYYDRRKRLKDMESDGIKRLERERSSSYDRHRRRGGRHEIGDLAVGSDQGRSRDNTDISRSRTLRDDREYERRQHKNRDIEWERDSKREKRRDRSRDRGNGRDAEKDKLRGINKVEKFSDRELQLDRDKIRRGHSYSDQENGCSSRDHRGKKLEDSEVLTNFRDEDVEDDYEKKVLLELAELEENDSDNVMEKSRQIRQAVTVKYQNQPRLQAIEQEPGIIVSHIGYNKKGKDSQSLSRDADVVFSKVTSEGIVTTLDSSDIHVIDSVVKSSIPNGNMLSGKQSGKAKDTDIFRDDIFGGSPVARKPGKDDGLTAERSGLHDNWDDAEGYYSFRFGEVLDERFEITALHGKGVFSAVVRAKDLKPVKDNPSEVAIKIIRNNETMYKAGCGELVILNTLVGADPEDRRHCVRFFSSFKYHNHLCLVFESLHMNLREVLRKFGRNIGLKLTAVRAYAKQLFIALKHLRNCGVLHCDIKPDNMLVNEAKNVLKLCDFGNAMFAGKNEITPYLVSRFYRAPEIILGLTYDYPMDMWSVGCCLYEFYTGKVLFRGATNNEMLRLQMELKGMFPKKMLRKGAFTEQHFDQDFNFYATEDDPVTKKKVKRLLINMKPKDMGSLMSSSPGEDSKMVSNFKDLLDRIFVLDPDKRLTVAQALSHPFITGK